MIADYGLCHIYTETNSFEEALALHPFDDLGEGGGVPLRYINVGRSFLLLPFLLARAWGFWVGQWLLIWLIVLFLASMRGTVTGASARKSLVPDLRALVDLHLLHNVVGNFSCHQNNLVVCPITTGDICNALKSINSCGLWGQIIEVQGLNMLGLFINEIASGSSCLLDRSHTWWQGSQGICTLSRNIVWVIFWLWHSGQVMGLIN